MVYLVNNSKFFRIFGNNPHEVIVSKTPNLEGILVNKGYNPDQTEKIHIKILIGLKGY